MGGTRRSRKGKESARERTRMILSIVNLSGVKNGVVRSPVVDPMTCTLFVSETFRRKRMARRANAAEKKAENPKQNQKKGSDCQRCKRKRRLMFLIGFLRAESGPGVFPRGSSFRRPCPSVGGGVGLGGGERGSGSGESTPAGQIASRPRAARAGDA